MTEITITSLGAQGDGIADMAGQPVYVPFTLPGERVCIGDIDDGRASLLGVVEKSPERVEADCRHFGQCGGCALQHLEPDAYRQWKKEQLPAALAARGIDVEVAPLIEAQPHSRRRATFAATRTKKTLTLGYYMKGSHTIIPVEECPLVTPEIETALPMLARLVGAGLSRRSRASILVTHGSSGLDVNVSGGKPLDGALREILATQAAAGDIARISWDGEIVAERRVPAINLSGLMVTPPPGAFLQPSVEGEAALVSLVHEAVHGCTRIADLFSGCGTFTAALAPHASVHAVEGEKRSIMALERALREQSPLLALKPVTCETRDLARRPLLAEELEHYQAIVFDPPRAGAAAQVEEIARSRVPLVVAVSCNPATFARDARILLDGGYRLKKLTPVDQFLWSPHLELVAVFAKG